MKQMALKILGIGNVTVLGVRILGLGLLFWLRGPVYGWQLGAWASFLRG